MIDYPENKIVHLCVTSAGEVFGVYIAGQLISDRVVLDLPGVLAIFGYKAHIINFDESEVRRMIKPQGTISDLPLKIEDILIERILPEDA